MNPGQFIWFDLASTDVPAAIAFYSALFGWTAEAHGPDGDYWMIKVLGHQMGGFMNAAPGTPSHWVPYMATGDLDAAVATITGGGGRILYGPVPIEGTGRFVVAMDPQRASFGLMQLDTPQPVWRPAKGENGIGWTELHATDLPGQLAFYDAVFGWEKDTMDMGPAGTYWFLGSEHNGGAMAAAPGMPSAWLLYVNVVSADETVARVKELGGVAMVGPFDAHGVGRMAILRDPTGAVFAIMQSFNRG